MFFSIIMPVYNSEKFLKSSISSVLNQTYTDFEFIIIDDGSNDNSRKIVDEYAAKDSRIKFFAQVHSGVSTARNLALSMVQGDYVSFIDSDDVIDADTFSVCMKKLKKRPSDMLIYSVRYIAQNGAKRLNISPLKDYFYSSIEDFMQIYLSTGAMSIYPNWNKFYRRTVIEKHNIRFISGMHFGEDRIFNYAFLPKAESVITLSNPFYSYHLRNNESLSSHFINNFMETVLYLHRAKIACVLPYAKSPDELSRFIIKDLRDEVINALNHLEQHWKMLSVNQRLSECRLLINSDYPVYFNTRELTQNSKLLSCFKVIVKLKSTAMLYVMFMIYQRSRS